VANQKRLTAGKIALLLVLSAVGAFFSVRQLTSWHVYLGLALTGFLILFFFLLWNKQR
jgi:hypothetical protein